jgi:hypothetical protein
MLREYMEIQQAVDSMLNIKSVVRRKKKREADRRKDLFFSIIQSLERLSLRQDLMIAELDLDFGKYDESFLEVIDRLILLHFGNDGAELIGWYLWERINPDGSLNYLLDENDQPFTVENPGDLWALLLAINSGTK